MREPDRLVVGPGAEPVRRAIGPTAWAALEALAARADARSGHSVVAANVRHTANALGLSKNAAHRAIRRLIDAGLVEPTQRRAPDGRYLTGYYRLTFPPDVLTVELATKRAPSPVESRATTPRRRRTDRTGQLDLPLDAG
jgi:DNA-binding transcriptional ArsR family regulator